jgi:signal-transduction protein with cAMP-binding, CBS, and nucleotidyltransferase domain
VIETVGGVGGEVVTVNRHASVYEVARRMQREAVGCVVVLDDEALPVGVLTDRDLALRILAADRDAGSATAESVMSQPLIAVQASDPLERVIACMSEHGIRRVPVLQEGRVTSIVTLDDLLSHLGRELDGLGTSVNSSFVRSRVEARRAAALEQMRSEVESRLHGLRDQVDHVGAQAKEALLREFDAIRDRVRRILE